MPVFPRVAALTAATVVASGLVLGLGAVPASAEEIYLRPADGIFRIDGHGWGHGRGLSQWGSQGAATQGVLHTQILETYYPGTTSMTLTDSPMRVLIQEDEGTDTQVSPATNLAMRDVATAARHVLPGGPTRWRALADANGMHVQHYSNGAWHTFSAGGTSTWAGPIQFEGATPLRVHFGNGSAREYRGVVRSVKTSTSGVSTVNSLSLEQYLQGVVPRESPAGWHQEALRAQSVAARSYSAYKRAHVPASAQWDICSTTQCQVYGGMRLIQANGSVVELEAASTNSAIAATKGVVRAYQGGPIFAEYSSSNGGHSTAHATFPYLSAKPDPWDAIASPHHDWSAQVSAAQIEARYPSVGRLTRLRIMERDGGGDWGGRVRRVILEGVNTSGGATSVEATGGGIVLANQWPGSSNGLRGSWFRIRTALDATVVSKSADPTLVQPPGEGTRDLTVVMRNRGMSSWSVDGLHLAVASPAGAPDPLSGGATRPGTFIANRTTPGAPQIAPGEDAEFRLTVDAGSLKPATYKGEYRLRVHEGTPFGDPAVFNVTVAKAALTGLRAGTLPGPGTPTTGVDGGPAPVHPNGTVIVRRDSSIAVRIQVKNSGNIPWPVGGQVRLGRTGDVASRSAGPGWPAPSRAAVLGGAVGVTDAIEVVPGQIGYFDVTIHGNGHGGSQEEEIFAPVWDGRAWITGAETRLTVVRTDGNASRHAVLYSAMPPTISLPRFPGSATTVLVRMRNVGRDPWPVGGDRLGVPGDGTSPLKTNAWLAPSRPSALAANLSRPGTGSVYPGEVGEWRVPLAVNNVADGDYRERYQALVEGVAWYGPVASTTVRVRSGALGVQVVRVVASALVLPRSGSGAAYVDVKNTGNVEWPIGGALRLGVRGSSSPSVMSSWLAPSRPTALSANQSRPGATSVLPGEIGRFTFRMAGNNRAPGRYSETFGVLWEGWSWAAPVITISYTVS